MKRLVFIFLTFFSISCAHVEYYQRVVRLHSETIDDNIDGMATGFPVDDDTIITAGHFCRYVSERYKNGQSKEFLTITFVTREGKLSLLENASVEIVDEKIDLCIVKRKHHGLIPFVLKEKELLVREPVTTVSSPLGAFPFTADGFVVTQNKEDIVLNISGTFGSSGSPIIDNDGYVVGIILGKPPIFDHIMFGISASQINEFLEKSQKINE